MRALVTGGAGFIGSHLVDALLAQGDEVVVLDTLRTGRRENLQDALAHGAVLHEADVTDPRGLRGRLADARPEVVFHLAAQVDVRRSVLDPARDARINVEGTVNVLEAARRAGARRVVYASSGGAIYGEADALPTPESAPARPLSPYGQGKYAGEGYLEVYRQLHGLSGVAIRASNVYGPRQDPLGEAGVVAIFCARRLDGRPAVVYGDGHQTRDLLYVGDVVDAYLRAADSDLQGAVNVGAGRETSVLELADVLRGLGAGEGFEVTHVPARPGEVRRSCLDVGRASDALGWAPEAGLVDGLRLTLESLREAGQTAGAAR